MTFIILCVDSKNRKAWLSFCLDSAYWSIDYLYFKRLETPKELSHWD